MARRCLVDVINNDPDYPDPDKADNVVFHVCEAFSKPIVAADLIHFCVHSQYKYQLEKWKDKSVRPPEVGQKDVGSGSTFGLFDKKTCDTYYVVLLYAASTMVKSVLI